MHCPNCRGDFEAVAFKGIGGINIKGKRCLQCGGFWFERNQFSEISSQSAEKFDPPSANYSLQEFSFICPNDQAIMTEQNGEADTSGIRYWICPEGQESFIPKGQLALIARSRERASRLTSSGPLSRSKIAETTILIGLGAIFTVLSFNQSDFNFTATGDSPIPTAGPNIFTLLLLAVTYLSGTVLAVLGRKTSVIFMGWAVIAICLVGFSVIIFGP